MDNLLARLPEAEHAPCSDTETADPFAAERERRIALDYSVTREQLLALLRERVANFRPEELSQWEADGRFDSRLIDGQRRYVNSSISNLFFRTPELESRRLVGGRDVALDRLIYTDAMEARVDTVETGSPLGRAHRFEFEMTIRVRPGAVAEGETIRCWMPYPMEREFQTDVRLLGSTPEAAWVNGPQYAARSIYFEQAARADEHTVFQAQFTATTHARSVRFDAAVEEPLSERELAALAPFLSEQGEHVRFTPRLRALVAGIVDEEESPRLRARAIYDWVANNIRYNYAREYSTLPCIPEYVLDRGYGDCGQTALLFITMCRIAGVPARWQSGWIIYPQLTNLHDWSEIYLAPYGWVPVDADYAASLKSDFKGLTPSERAELHEFYFGGLDSYRMAVNSDHSHPHYPEKLSFRSDDVDFQRGELEAAGENIYFDQFDYALDVKYLDVANAAKHIKPRTAMRKPGVAR